MASDLMDGKDVKAGVTDAVDFWLSQHPISLGEIFHDAIREAVLKWFEIHDDELLEIVRAQMRRD